jgi:dethiobiotin synthetase
MNGIFITGTDTNIGKTWVGEHLISALRAKKNNLVLRKPIESGWDDSNVENTDAYLLAKAARQLDELNDICPNRFSRPISPVRAAALEGKKLSIEAVKNQCVNGVGADSFLYVEGAGGFYSPLCADGLNADLANALNLPLLLVAENRLGCINQVLLNVEAIKCRGLKLQAVVLNDVSDDKKSFDMNNAEDLAELLDCPIITTSYNDKSTDAFEKLALLISAS